MNKIIEINTEPSRITTGSTFFIRVKAKRGTTYNELKSKKLTYNELKKYTYNQLKGV